MIFQLPDRFWRSFFYRKKGKAMKRILLIFGLLLLLASEAKADSYQPCYTPALAASATYWNTLDNACNGCGEGCTSCRESLTTYADGITPLSQPFCTSCISGYELFSANGGTYQDCRKSCPSNCSSCSDSSTCTRCASGYTLSNGACVKTPTCTSGQYAGSDGSCRPCSDISIANGTCLSCSSSSQCDNISCDSGYVWMGGQTCVKAATCQYPLKEVADYSGECAGCCTD